MHPSTAPEFEGVLKIEAVYHFKPFLGETIPSQKYRYLKNILALPID